MTIERQRLAFAILIGAHLLLGLMMATLGRVFGPNTWPIWTVIWLVGLVASEIVLVGIWAGLWRSNSWIKVVGLVCGIAWLNLITELTSPNPYPAVLETAIVFGVPILTIAIISGLYRSRFANLTRRNDWQPVAISADLQFSVWALFGLTFFIAALLGLGRLVQWLDQGRSHIVLVVFVFTLLSLLATAMLVWACLGQGRLVVRLPTLLLGMLGLGLVFPYYLGGPPWRFLVWPALMAVVAIYASGSLLVVRACGYRLESIRRQTPSVG